MRRGTDQGRHTGGITDREARRRVFLTTLEFLHCQLSVGYRVEPDDPDGNFTVSDPLNFKGM